MNNRGKFGFTLIELLVVVGIIGVLLGLLLPAVQSVREAARRTTCANNERQIILAILSYESAHQSIPKTQSFDPRTSLAHWHSRLLPYLEHQSLFSDIQNDFADGIHVFDQDNATMSISVFQCPSEPILGMIVEAEDTGFQFSFTNYCGVNGTNNKASNGIFPTNLTVIEKKPIRLAMISSGLSNTLAFGERPPSSFEQGFGIWLGSQNALSASIGVNEGSAVKSDVECDGVRFRYPNNPNHCGVYHHWGHHPMGVNFARLDGSIHFVDYSIDLKVLETLATK